MHHNLETIHFIMQNLKDTMKILFLHVPRYV